MERRIHRTPRKYRSMQIGRAGASLRLSVVLLAGGLFLGLSTTLAAAAGAEPFKLTNIHFETNASACDMGIQIKFDTDGITSGKVKDPTGRKIYSFRSENGM